MQNKEELRRLALFHGASAFGVAEFGDLLEQIHPEIRTRAQSMPFAVCIGIEVQKAVLESLGGRPNEIYKSHYKAINARLDDITLRLSQAISDAGGQALPIPASKVISRYPMIGHLSHREFAYRAGLGWQGKNNLLINLRFGGRLRLATILTDLELPVDSRLESECGTCRACASLCPAGAIGDTPEDFDLEKCRDQVIFFSRDRNFGHLICGLCLNCCPERKNGKN